MARGELELARENKEKQQEKIERGKDPKNYDIMAK